MSPNSPPTVVGGYELVSLVARGGAGDVYAARRTGPGGFKKRVAVKLLSDAIIEDGALLDRYLADVGRAAAIEYPSMVQVLEVGESDGRPFLVQEYVEGVTLHDLLRRLADARRRLPAALAAAIVGEVAAAVRAAHALEDESGAPAPLVHGDLAADRVLLATATGQVKVFGFGGATARSVVPRTGPPEARLGHVAPECFEGAPPGPLADVYALGVMLYRAAIGRWPFAAKTDAGLLGAALRGTPVAPAKADPKFPPDLDHLIRHALARDPGGRLSSAAELCDGLERYLTTAPAHGPAELRRVMGMIMPARPEPPAARPEPPAARSDPPPMARAAPTGRRRRQTQPFLPTGARNTPTPEPAQPMPSEVANTVHAASAEAAQPTPTPTNEDLWAELDRLEREFGSNQS